MTLRPLPRSRDTAPDPKTPNDLLWEAFEAHGLYPVQHKGWLFPTHDTPMPMVQAIWRPNNDQRIGELDIHVVFSDGRILTDTLVGIQGATDALRDAFANFLGGSFHVMLSALWNRHDPDQVSVERWVVNDRPYDAFIGGARLRSLNGVIPAFPENTFSLVHDAIRAEQLTQELHWAGISFCWTIEDERSGEAHLDNKPWMGGAEALVRVDWPRTGSVWSIRYFIMLKLAENDPGSGTPAPSPKRSGFLSWLKKK